MKWEWLETELINVKIPNENEMDGYRYGIDPAEEEAHIKEKEDSGWTLMDKQRMRQLEIKENVLHIRESNITHRYDRPNDTGKLGYSREAWLVDMEKHENDIIKSGLIYVWKRPIATQ